MPYAIKRRPQEALRSRACAFLCRGVWNKYAWSKNTIGQECITFPTKKSASACIDGFRSEEMATHYEYRIIKV